MDIIVLDYHLARRSFVERAIEQTLHPCTVRSVPQYPPGMHPKSPRRGLHTLFVYDGQDSNYEALIGYLNNMPDYEDKLLSNLVVGAYQFTRVQEPQMKMPEDLYIVDVSDIEDIAEAQQFLTSYVRKFVPTIHLAQLKS